MQEIYRFYLSLVLTKETSAVNYILGQLLTMSHSADQQPALGSRFLFGVDLEQASFAGERALGGAMGRRFVRRPGTD